MESKQFQRLFFDAKDYALPETLPLPEHLKPPPPHRRSRKEIREAREKMRRRYQSIFGDDLDGECGQRGAVELPPIPASDAPLGLTPTGRPKKKRKPTLFYLIPDVPCSDEYDASPAHREAMRIIYEERAVAVQRSWTENKERKRNNYPANPIVFGPTDLSDQ